MKKIIIIISVLIVVIILAFVWYASISSKVSQGFINKHNEIVYLEKEVEKISNLSDMPEMKVLDEQMSSENYEGALKSIEVALDRKKETASKLNSIEDKLAELEKMSLEIANTEARKAAVEFISLSKREKTAKINYNNLQIEMIEKTKEMINILVKGAQALSIADSETIIDLSEKIMEIRAQFDEVEKELSDIQNQYKIAEKAFFELANLETGEQ